MMLYMGVHLYSINGHYMKAKEVCQRMIDLVIKKRVDVCLPIYLVLMVKLKANQGEWTHCLSFISKALCSSWVHNQQDL